ncbi:tRNA (N6-threonylcarbamoyladenosine(37)-N6)-methyltransferase TrmO [Celerinatantimonas sp. YJH-8]|uniref:tRNA (N6-threonylcarbamoyladenosine(37)-N6)-methyltransferase TrmO n=1 Tax=Celerinatantimonas sp. YJH-8 TaxID=3228714 RepID=UPI0038C6ED91
MDKYTIEPIGYIRSPYLEKFAVPRQPGLVTTATTQLQLIEPYNAQEIIDGIEQFSHYWLIFGFHQNQGWKNKVRPPRLGGNQKIGVFASRSTFRPNGMGLSVLELSHIDYLSEGPCLSFHGGDLVNGTPVFDIKPYLDYADHIEHTRAGYAAEAPTAKLDLQWSEIALRQQKNLGLTSNDIRLIEDVLRQDPRPSYRYKPGKADHHHYGVQLIRFNIRFIVTGEQCQIIEISPL